MGTETGSSNKASILVVDDTPDYLALMSNLLKDEYKVKVATNGEKALRIAQTPPQPDLVLLDIMMPGMDGYEICRLLKECPESRNIPIIFFTVQTDMEEEKRGLELGAVDYITKPISPPIVLARVKTHLTLKASADFLRDKNTYLEQEIFRRTREIKAIQDITMLALASLAETRDLSTGNHIQRTQQYIKALALKLQRHPRFTRFLTDQNITLLVKSAPLHDIGKVGIPDHILLKPGFLDPPEMEIMKTHTILGWDALEHAEKTLGIHIGFLQMAKEITLYHQEKWDGTGYPKGLSGDDIPIPARLMAVADVYDALISRRIYKEVVSHEQAVRIVWGKKNTHFDPDIVDAFREIQDTFLKISQQYADPGFTRLN